MKIELKVSGFPLDIETIDDVIQRFKKMQDFIYRIVESDTVPEDSTDSYRRKLGLCGDEFAEMADAARAACDAIPYRSVTKCQIHRSLAHEALRLPGAWSVYWGDHLIVNTNTREEAEVHARGHEADVLGAPATDAT